MRFLIATKAYFICTFLFLSSCSNNKETTLNTLTPIVNKEYSISLEKPVFLESSQTYNLHWNSDLPEYKTSYNLSVNGKLLKRNLTETVISENTIEFNVPLMDYNIPNDILNEGKNTLQIIAEYNGTEIHQSNKIEIMHSESNYLASN